MFFIRGRKKWGAEPPKRGVTTQDPRGVHTLVVHHTAGRIPAANRVVEELQSIQRQHQNTNGWTDIGYNVLIDRQGRCWEGRGLRAVGAHTLGHNTGTFGVSFLGNYEVEKPNRYQLVAFKLLKKRLRLHGYRFKHVKGHNQMPGQATACPGKYLTEGLNL